MEKHEKEKPFKKVKHGKLGKIVEKKGNFSKEEKQDIEDATNPYSWEKFCGACDNFETEDCPYKGVDANTRWREEIDCKKFWD